MTAEQQELLDDLRMEHLMLSKRGGIMQRLHTILYNALVLLVDETFEQYDDKNKWFAMIQNELGCTAEELAQYGIKITANSDIAIKRCTITDKMYRGVPKQNYYPFSQAWEQYCQDGFVYGSLVVANGKCYICVSALCCANSFINNGVTSMIEVEPETIGRNTLCKDTDDTTIFEGDILHVSSDEHKYDYETKVGNRDSFISGLYVDGEFEDGSDWAEIGLAMAEWREEGATIKIVGCSFKDKKINPSYL